jgi:mono/diheme cytochrome c family protein
MKNQLIISLAAAIAASMVVSARAEDKAADQVASGRAFALSVCAACHVVAKDQSRPPILKPPAPSFFEIMQRPNVSEKSLREFLSSRHGGLGEHKKMPNPGLAPFQIDKIVAYLMTLKSAR